MAFILYKPDSPFNGRRSEVVSHDKAIELKKALRQPDGLTKAQKAYICHIKAIYLGRTTSEKVLAEKQPDIQSHWSETDLK